MKKGLLSFAAPVTVALILGLAVYAVPAMGTSTSLANRVSKLEAANKKLTAASAKLTAANVKLTKRVTTLEVGTAASEACLKNVAGVTVAGNPTTGSGYVFTADNAVTFILAPALAPTPTGTTPSAIIQLVDPACVTSGKRNVLQARHLETLVHHRH